MKNLEEKKLLVKMMRAFGQPVDQALVESIEREEKLMEAFFGVKKEEPKPIEVIVPEILPDPVIEEPEVIVAEAAVEELPPQPEEPAETGVLPPEEVRVKQVSDYLTAISKLPSDSNEFKDKELGEIRKTVSDLLKKVNTLSWGGGGTGIVRIGQADDFDRASYTEGYVLTWSNGMFRLLPAGATGNTLVTSNDGSVTVAPITGGYDLSIANYIHTQVENIFTYVTNDEQTETIHKGDPVYLYRATGNRPSVKLARNTSDQYSAKTLGLAAENINAGNPGWVQTQGVLTGVDTHMYNEGDTLYLGNTFGTLANTKPYAPNHLVYMGVVVRANQGQGQIYIKPQNGYELDEIHDVNINHNNAIANGQTIVWNSTNSLWENRNYSYTDLTNKPTGTANYIPKFATSTTFGDSNLINANGVILTQRTAAPIVFNTPGGTIPTSALCSGYVLLGSSMEASSCYFPTGSAIDTELGLSGATPVNVTFDCRIGWQYGYDTGDTCGFNENTGTTYPAGSYYEGFAYQIADYGASTVTFRFYRTGAGTWNVYWGW